MMVQGNRDTLDNTLSSSYLVGAHHQQFFIYIEHTIFGKNFEQRTFNEEGLGKVLQVADKIVFPIAPVAGKLKRVALNFLFLSLLLVSFLLTSIAGCITVILGLCAIADDKQLDVIKHSLACPEAFTSIAVYLIKGFPDTYTSTFQLNMNEWQTVHQDGYIIAVGMGSTSGHVLVDNLQIVLEHVIFMDKMNIGFYTVVSFYFYCGIFLLNHAGLIFHRERFASQNIQQALPLLVRVFCIVCLAQLYAQVLQQFFLIVYGRIFVTLSLQLFDKPAFKFLLALVSITILP